jgi:hypothetical protein
MEVKICKCCLKERLFSEFKNWQKFTCNKCKRLPRKQKKKLNKMLNYAFRDLVNLKNGIIKNLKKANE